MSEGKMMMKINSNLFGGDKFGQFENSHEEKFISALRYENSNSNHNHNHNNSDEDCINTENELVKGIMTNFFKDFADLDGDRADCATSANSPYINTTDQNCAKEDLPDQFCLSTAQKKVRISSFLKGEKINDLKSEKFKFNSKFLSENFEKPDIRSKYNISN